MLFPVIYPQLCFYRLYIHSYAFTGYIFTNNTIIGYVIKIPEDFLHYDTLKQQLLPQKRKFNLNEDYTLRQMLSC